MSSYEPRLSINRIVTRGGQLATYGQIAALDALLRIHNVSVNLKVVVVLLLAGNQRRRRIQQLLGNLQEVLAGRSLCAVLEIISCV